MSISVVVTTSPGREANLQACLQQLTQQDHPEFEVLVCDDGSAEGGRVVQSFTKQLSLRYFYRPNDMRVARSRNQGMEAAKYKQWVLIDGDVLLNPKALTAYAQLLEKQPERLWAGYFGSVKNYTAPSCWQPHRTVNYLDKRYALYSRQQLQPCAEFRTEPGNGLWSGNFALHADVGNALKGFDTSFVGWGVEDVEFGYRALNTGYEIHFCIDPWAEHQMHSYEESFHTTYREQDTPKTRFLKARKHPTIDYTVEVVGTPAVMKALCHQMLSGYAQQDPQVSDIHKQQFQHPQARLMLRDAPWGHNDMGCALPKGAVLDPTAQW